MKISDKVLNILEGSTIHVVDYNTTALALNGQLDRKTYVEVNKVLECLGGKWSKKSKSHLFVGDVKEVIEQAMLTGQVTDAKKEFQFFETPKDLAYRMVQAAGIRPGMTVLEPSAGKGAIAQTILDQTGINPDCVELWDENRKFLESKKFNLVKTTDFLLYNPVKLYDRIVANPPFTRQQDVDHVLHMYDCLKTGGKIVTIMSPSWTFRENSKSVAFRDTLEKWGAEWEELSAGTFSESGTEIRTILLMIEK